MAEHGVWDGQQGRFIASQITSPEQAARKLDYWQFEYRADEEDPGVLSIREVPDTPGLVIMPHDWREYARMRAADPSPADCPTCTPGYPVPHWPLSAHCGGGNAPGKVIRPHCTCDGCF